MDISVEQERQPVFLETPSGALSAAKINGVQVAGRAGKCLPGGGPPSAPWDCVLLHARAASSARGCSCAEMTWQD